MSDIKEIPATQTIPENRMGYKIKEPTRQQIWDYLDSRPFNETDALITLFFEGKDPETTYYRWSAIMMLTDYLKEKCPRKEIKGFLLALTTNIEAYQLPEEVEFKG
jgi:hypothetical protein